MADNLTEIIGEILLHVGNILSKLPEIMHTVHLISSLSVAKDKVLQYNSNGMYIHLPVSSKFERIT